MQCAICGVRLLLCGVISKGIVRRMTSDGRSGLVNPRRVLNQTVSKWIVCIERLALFIVVVIVVRQFGEKCTS